MGLDGSILHRIERLHKRHHLTPPMAAHELANLAQELLAELPDGAAWVGTGIAMPAVVDSRDGLVRFAPNLGWIDVNLRALVMEEFTDRFDGAPETIVDNDANLGALAESVRGAGAEIHSLVFICGDIGIGSGVIVDGAVMTGADGYAGEIGHMVVNPQGIRCRCGARGCWETEIGSTALLRAAGADFSDVPSVVHAAREGNEEALMALKVVTDWLALGLGNLANAYNPDVIILGGHLKYLAQFAEGAVRSHLHAWSEGRQHSLPLREPGLGEDSSLLGAGEAAFEGLLADPLTYFADAYRLSD